MVMQTVQQILLIVSIIVALILLVIVLRFLIHNLPFLIIFFFRSSMIRRMALWLSHNAGRMRSWMRSKWLPPIFWLLVVTIVVWLVENLNKFNLDISSWFQGWSVQGLYTLIVGTISSILSQWVTILVLFTLSLLIWSVWKAGRRVVVEEFVDYTGAQTSGQTKPIAGGLATLLVVRLAELRNLYQAVDEQRAIPTAVWINQSIDATINVEDVSQFLKDAVSAQSEFNLGPFKIPVGTLLSLLGRIVQGPRIVGSLHKDGNTFILTAQKFDGKSSQSWRVDHQESSVQGDQQRNDRFTNMVEELAYRIFTDLALNGSVRWTATCNFCEGLQAYRDCLNSPKDRRLKLEVAQQKLIETLAEDQKFEMAYYNLGVVYTELEQLDAAKIAFSSAIKEYPGSWNAYYALALNRYQSRDAEPECESIIQLCTRVIDLKPGAANVAKAYQLRGLAQTRLGRSDRAIRSFRMAVAYSWRALCVAELNGQGVRKDGNNVLVPLETLVSACLADLASQYKQFRVFALLRAKALLRQALRLEHAGADYYANCYFQLGEMYFARKKCEVAAREYRHAARIYPERTEYVASQALAYAKASRKGNNKEVRAYRVTAARDACQQALDCASQVSEIVIQKVAEAYEELGDKDRGTQVRGMKQFLEDVKGKQDVSELEAMSGKFNAEGKEWECGQIYRVLGHRYSAAGDFIKAKDNFGKAIEKLQLKHPEEVRIQRLYTHQAYALLEQKGKEREAVELMEQAVKLDSVGFREREALGYIYYRLNQFDQAIEAWQEALSRRNALLRKPDDDEADILLNIGISYVSLAMHCREYQIRSQAFWDATRYLKQARDLYESDRQEQKAKACYWLGRLHIELGKYWEATSFLKVSQSLGFAPLTSSVYLGYAYLRNREYDESIEQFKSLLDDAKKLDDAHFAVDDIIEAESGVGEMSLGELLAMAYWGQAFAFAQRNANLENALKYIQVDAQRELKRLDLKKTTIRWPAIYPDCEGWVLHRLGRAAEAVKCLEQAVEKETDAEYYLHLALAYIQQLQVSRDKTVVDKVQAAYQQIVELDIEKRFEKDLGRLLQRLNEITQELSAPQPRPSLLKRIF